MTVCSSLFSCLVLNYLCLLTMFSLKRSIIFGYLQDTHPPLSLSLSGKQRPELYFFPSPLCCSSRQQSRCNFILYSEWFCLCNESLKEITGLSVDIQYVCINSTQCQLKIIMAFMSLARIFDKLFEELSSF